MSRAEPKPARPRNATPRPDHGAGREALLRAVIRVVARQGFAGVTYRSVAAEAGVTYGLVTYHFGSLEAMVRDALRLAASETVERSNITLAGGDVGGFADTLASLVSDNPEGEAAQFEMLLEARRRRELLPDMRAVYESFYAVIDRTLADLDLGGDPDLAHLVFAAIDGLVLQQLLFEDRERTDAALEALRDILDGLRRSPPRTRARAVS
jgi:AcrR family transcriptional regulator